MPLEVPTQNVQGFLDSFLSPEKQEEQVHIAPTPIQQALDDLTKPTEVPEKDTSLEKSLSKEELEASINKVGEVKKTEEEKVLIKDIAKFSEALKEKNLLIAYEDGTLPSTEEEVFDALLQSSQFNAQQTVDAAWKEKIDGLSPSLLKIHEYAARGVTTAQQLAEFTNAVAQTELIGALELTSLEDQEQIVLLQLLNTGIDEKSAREEIEDLKASNKLEDRAKRFYPALKKAYDENQRRLDSEKAQVDEERQRYVFNNAENVKYFLEKDVEYLPFKIEAKDNQYKSAIFNLAAQQVDANEDGTPIFGWQKQLEILQYGSETDYKRFMKVMAFLANDKKYDEGVSKKVKTATEIKEFKKIGTTTGTSVNQLSTEQEQPIGIKKKTSTLPSSAWG